MRRIGERLNDTIRTAVKNAGDARLEFVDVAASFRGHEPCGNKGEWINGVSLTAKKRAIDDESFHPNERGQRAYADIINDALSTGGP